MPYARLDISDLDLARRDLDVEGQILGETAQNCGEELVEETRIFWDPNRDLVAHDYLVVRNLPEFG